MPLFTSKTADDKKTGLTLGDLRQFIAEAERADIDPGTLVRATAGMRGQLISVRTQEPK